MNKIQVLGMIICGLAIAMLLFGVSIFTYTGNSLNPVISWLGKYSFLFWLPVLMLGGIFIIAGHLSKNDQQLK
jgi:hypothetical protein